MTPEEKVAVINFLIEVENAEDYALYHKERIDKFPDCGGIVEKLEKEWQGDVFVCPSCARCFTLDDGINVGGDFIDGKAGSPPETVCRGCAQNV